MLEIRPRESELEFFEALAKLGNAGPMLELPMGPSLFMARNSKEVLLSAYHLRPTSSCHASFRTPEVADVLAGLDLFLVTSDREGMSNAMLESLWAGTPVVSTAVSGAEEALLAPGGAQRPGWWWTPTFRPS